MHRSTRSALAMTAACVAGTFIVSAAWPDELLWTTENWHNSTTETSHIFAGQFPQDREVADDFDVLGDISRIVISGRGCSQCSTPTVEGVFVRFYEWSAAGPGALQQEFFLDRDDPDFSYNQSTPGLLDITLPESFAATGKHYVAVQLFFDNEGGYWAVGRAGRNNPKVGPVYFRDNLNGGEWGIDIDYLGYETDAAFELFGPDPVNSPWTYVPSPPGRSAHLWNVRDVAGPTDVWAVGYDKEYYNQFSYDALSLALHWDGSSWTQVPTPSPGVYSGGGTDVALWDVSGVASDDVWAVGNYKIQHPDDNFIGFQTFAIHWDGASWMHVETPVTVVGSTGAGLHSIATVRDDHAYAVGWRADPNFGDQVDWIGHAVHWDGSEWTSLPDPPLGGRRNELQDMAMLDADRFIAVGGHSGNTYGARDQPYVLEWDGDSWSTITVPVPPGQNFLESVVVVAPDNIWIAGKNDQVNQGWQPLFIHFDGSDWTVFTNVLFDHYGGEIRSITANAPDDIWASGSHTLQSGGFTRPLLMHFDGTVWQQVATDPNGPDSGTLFAVDAVSNGEVWTVGTGSGRTHTQHLAAGGSQGTILPFTEFSLRYGSLMQGGLAELIASDDAHLRTRSQFGFSVIEPNITEVNLIADGDGLQSATAFEVDIESRINNSGGTATVKLRNWSTNRLETIHTYNLTQLESIESLTGITTDNRIRANDGRAELAIRHAVMATFSVNGFDSFFDQIELRAR